MRKSILILGHNDATQFIDIFNQYTRLFDPKKFEVTVAYLTGEPNDETKKRTIAEHVIFLNASKKSIRGLKIGITWRLFSLTRKKKFDIVICHRYKPSYIMLWVNRFSNITALFCVMHELATMSGKHRSLLMRFLSKPNTYFAGVSNAVRDDLRKDLHPIPKTRIITLYNTIDMLLAEPALMPKDEARAALKLSPTNFVFGNIGRLVPNKDQATLIEAFALMKPHCPHAKLILMGDGELEDTLSAKIKSLGLQQDIKLMGFVPLASRFMRAFDVFALSSTQEAFGRVLIEAMVAKLPIIATRVNGIPEVMGETGILIPEKNSVLLAEKMQLLYQMNAKEREAMGESAYQHVTDHFSIPAFQQQFWSLPLLQTIKG